MRASSELEYDEDDAGHFDLRASMACVKSDAGVLSTPNGAILFQGNMSVFGGTRARLSTVVPIARHPSLRARRTLRTLSSSGPDMGIERILWRLKRLSFPSLLNGCLRNACETVNSISITIYDGLYSAPCCWSDTPLSQHRDVSI